MDRAYWDRLAATFSDDVLEITDYDSRGVLTAAVRRLADPQATAADFGCGVGATTRLLAPHFANVVGLDFSPALIEQARERTRARNVSYVVANLGARRRPPVAADIGFCVNCLLSPDYGTRSRIAHNVGACIRGSGPAVFVVPSFESILQTYQAMVEIAVLQGEPREPSAQRASTAAQREVRSAVDGIVDVGGQPTKHYLGDEIAHFLTRLRFAVEELDRVEYPWEVEFDLGSEADAIIDHLRPRKPWDWLVHARAPAHRRLARR